MLVKTHLEKPISEERALLSAVGAVVLGTIVTRPPFEAPIWTLAESFSFSLVITGLPVYLLGCFSRKKGCTPSKLHETTPTLGSESAPEALIRTPKNLELGAEAQPLASETALVELEKRLDRLESGAQLEESLIKALGKLFPENWKALGERSLAREMMLNEKKASAVSGKAVKTLQNERTLMTGIPHIKDGNFVRYRLGDILDYVQDKKQRFGNY